MKKNLIISLRLTAVMILLCGVLFPLLIALVGKASTGGGNGEKVFVNGKPVGYENIGQKFTDDKYFQGRPSAVDYNAAGSAGSNKGPSNPDYLKIIQNRIDTFLVHNPGIRKEEVPAELVTASGSGLDPHLSLAGASIQVKRIALIRHLPEQKIRTLIQQYTEKPFLGPQVINVLKLNVALDQLK